MKLVIIGGAGALGRNIIQNFTQAGHSCINIDYFANPEADTNIIIKSADEGVKLESIADLVICVAGSWKGTAQPFTYTESLSTWMALESSNIKPALLAATLATKHNCRVVLTSAAASLHACPGMVEYGMVKSAINMLAKSMKVGALVLMPAVLDTPANHRDMPNADTSHWTPLDHISSYLLQYYADNQDNTSCEFIVIKTNKGKTCFEKSNY